MAEFLKNIGVTEYRAKVLAVKEILKMIHRQVI